MEFFDKKEEVIDIKLTQFGRHLLSKGKFKPVYYSFFDDNILYDSEKAGFSETQNESEPRIKETPTTHPQISFSSLEKDFGNSYNLILSGEISPISQELQRSAEKSYSLAQPIGSSDINSEYAPSWSVQFLNGQLSGSSDTISLVEKTGGTSIQKIPQLETKIEIEVMNIESDGSIVEESEDGMLDSNVVLISEEEDMFLLLKVAENNGFFQKKNFDIEIFEVVEEIQDGVTIEELRPLSFSKQHEATTELSFLDEPTPIADQTHVDYYFDVLVDDEIDQETLCQFDPVNEKMGVFSDPRTKLCQDVINQQKKKVFDIYEDDADSPGEIC